MSGGINFEFGFGQHSAARQDEDSQSRFYCCGDFCGSTASSPITGKIVNIDVDNFDAVMAKFSPTLTLSSNQVLVFKELDDFHPDQLVATVPEFVELRRLKRGLDNPQTAAAVAAEIWQTYQPKATESSDTATTESESITDTLERLLDRKTSLATPDIKSKSTVDSLLQQLISPVIVADTLPEHQALSEFIDSVMADLMKTILHNPEFQALESSWRSVYALLFNEDADENQHFYLVNISKQALLADMCSGMTANFANLLIDHGIKNVDSTIIGNYYFSGNDVADLALLGLLGMLAGQLHSRFISAVDEAFVKEQILGDQPLTPHWQNLRQSPAAAFIGLCYPRILLRLPYGKKREPVDAFAFEEFDDAPNHEQLLWGNSAFGFARLLVRQQSGYQGDGANDIEGLPALVCLKEDEQHLYACGEWFLSEQKMNKLLTAGIMPFISFHNRNGVRLIASQSLEL